MKLKFINLLFAAGLAVLLTVFGGCYDHGTDNQRIYGSGDLVSENRPASSFTSVSVEGSAEVQLLPSDTESLRIEADDNIIDKVITEIEDGTLHIYLEKGSYTNITVRAYVSMKKLESLSCSGSASFETKKPFDMDEFRCRINGSSSVKISGRANKEAIEISGTGNVSNYNLEASEAKVTISGAGNVQVTVKDKLEAVISGTGNITYDGNPQVVNQKIFGVGAINKRK